MCLILFAYDCHPRYRLVVAANRDEYFNRPTLPAAFWQDSPNILAGRDLEHGGTWMGITKKGRFAALTNYRDPFHNNPHVTSRGLLIPEYLSSDSSPESFIENLRNEGADYKGFSLLLGTTKSLNYYSNREKAFRKVDKGIHGISNNLLDVPWPKVAKGMDSLARCLQDQEIKKEQLFEIMADQEQADDHDLPQTGESLEWERILSPVFIVSPEYGTRSTTVVLVDRNGHIWLWERSYKDGQLQVSSEVFYEFDVEESD